MINDPVNLSVSEFVAVANQTLEFAYPSVVITGELANFKVSKGKWVYFDLKDEYASVRFFGTVYNLSGPIEDGMLLSVRGTPKLHPQFGFSVTIQQISLVGEGTIKRAATLLQAKLQKEGLFDVERKRPLPYPPERIGLITSAESAAFHDFMKILKARWNGVEIMHVDVQVQGVDAVTQIIQAITALNQHAEEPDVLVIIRGGGNPEDLQVFSDESVVRTVAASRIPILVGIGHENDISLAELAADVRASTPSNAAELLTPDKSHIIVQLGQTKNGLKQMIQNVLSLQVDQVKEQKIKLSQLSGAIIDREKQSLEHYKELLMAYNPQSALERGFAIIRKENKIVRSGATLAVADGVIISMQDADIHAKVTKIESKKG